MINIDDLKNSDRICVFIRHGEKDTFNFGLTNKGKNDAIEFGKLVSMLKKPVKVYSSPEERCIETANIINTEVNGIRDNVTLSEILGKPGIQVKNETEYIKLTNVMRCRDIYAKWKTGMFRNAMNNTEFIKENITRFLDETSLNNGITIYISQSGTVACTGFALGLIDIKGNDEDWIDFLDGFIMRF